MELMLPPVIESELPKKRSVIVEPNPPKAETYTIGTVDEFAKMMADVRTMITMAIGTLKEVKAQVREKPGARFLIGEILSCLGQAKVATKVDPSKLNFKKL